MGFYWDDWPLAWFSEISNSESLKWFEFQRPLAGWFFNGVSKILGEVPINWHLFMLLLRFLSGIVSMWLINTIWPEKKTQAFLIAALVLVFPGFGQQFISITGSRHILGLTLSIASLAIMVLAERSSSKRWLLRIISIMTALIGMLITEYFYGLEIIRPFILRLTVKNRDKGTKELLTSWLPYLFFMLSVFIWRASITQFGNYSINLINNFAVDTQYTILHFGETVFEDVVTATWGAWELPFIFPYPVEIGTALSSYYWTLVGIISLGMFLYLASSKTWNSDQKWPREAIWLGLTALIGGGTSYWVTGLTLSLNFPADRLVLPMMLGSSLIFIGLLELMIKPKIIKTLILSAFIGLAIGWHFLNAISYRVDWEKEVYFFNQLALRIPDLRDGTTLISEELPFSYATDNSLTAPLNWIYSPEFSAASDYYDWEYRIEKFEELPLMIRYLDLRLDWQLPLLEDEANYSAPFRFFRFFGSSKDVLLLYFREPYCLRILDPVYDDGHPHFLGAEYYSKYPGLLDPIFSKKFPNFPVLTTDAMQYSKTDLILVNSINEKGLLPEILQTNTADDWCYSFQKAELARQQGDWEKVAKLGDLALSEMGKVRHSSELPVFIEAYAHIEDFDKADEISRLAIEMDASMKKMLCATWTRIEKSTNSSKEIAEHIKLTKEDLNCE